MIRLRKTWSVILAVMLVITAFPAAVCAATTSGAASELRLARAEGTVGVVKSGGQKLSVKAGMRLYSGYKVTTQKKSYGYVSLDSAKAVKLDASSAGKVLQSGKKLELQLVSGKMMFNVSAPLKSGESMNIRTSTMVAGVRGTAGWVEINDRYTSSIHLLEGTLEVSGINPADGKIQTVTIHGGETVVGTLKQGTRGTTLQLMTGKFSEADVPGFVAVEVAADTALQQKITQLSDLSVPLIIKNAAQNLAAEEAAAQAADQALQAAIAKTKADSVDPYYKQNSGSGGGGGGSAGGSGGSGTGETGNGGGQASETTLKAPSDASVINKALESNTVVNVAPADNAANGTQVDLNGLNVAAGKTLNIQSGVNATNDLTNDTAGTVTVAGTMNVQSGATLTNNGVMNVTGEVNAAANSNVTNNGDMNVSGTLNVANGATFTNNNDSTINITSRNSVHVAGTLTNAGIINVGKEDGAGLLEVQDDGTITNTDGTGTINVSYDSASSPSTMTVAGRAAVSNQKITVFSQGTLTNDGAIGDTSDGSIPSVINSGGEVTNNGTITGKTEVSSGYFTNVGSIENTAVVSGGSLTNSGTITSSQNDVSTVNVNGGTFNNTGGGIYNTSSGAAVSVSSGSAVVSSGTVSSSGNTAIAVSVSEGFVVNISETTVKAQSKDVITGIDESYTLIQNGDGSYQIYEGTVVDNTPGSNTLTLSGDDATQEKIQKAFANGYKTVNVEGESGVSITGTLTVPENKTLNLKTGGFEESDFGTISVSSSAIFNVSSSASITMSSIVIDENGSMDNQGTICAEKIVVSGSFINNGPISYENGYTEIEISSTGTFNNSYGKFSLVMSTSIKTSIISYGTLINNGVIDTNQISIYSGTLVNNEEALITGSGYYLVMLADSVGAGTYLKNNGTIDNSSGMALGCMSYQNTIVSSDEDSQLSVTNNSINETYIVVDNNGYLLTGAGSGKNAVFIGINRYTLDNIDYDPYCYFTNNGSIDGSVVMSAGDQPESDLSYGCIFENYGWIDGDVTIEGEGLIGMDNFASGVAKSIRLSNACADLYNYGLIGYVDLEAGIVKNESSGRIDTDADGDTGCVYSDGSIKSAVYIDASEGKSYFDNSGTVSYKVFDGLTYDHNQYTATEYAIYVKTSTGAVYTTSKPAISINTGTVESYSKTAVCIDSGNVAITSASAIISKNSKATVRAKSDESSSEGSNSTGLYVVSNKFKNDVTESYIIIGNEQEVEVWEYASGF